MAFFRLAQFVNIQKLNEEFKMICIPASNKKFKQVAEKYSEIE